MKAEAGCKCANISDANITVLSGNGKFPTLIRQTGEFYTPEATLGSTTILEQPLDDPMNAVQLQRFFEGVLPPPNMQSWGLRKSY